MFTYQLPFGLDISDLSLKLVSLKKKGKQIQLASYNQIKVPEGYFVDGEIKEKEKIIKLIKKLIETTQGEKIRTPYVISVLPETKTFIKLIEVPKSLDNKIDPEAVKEEIKRHIPISLDETYFDWQKIAPREDKMKILVTTVPKKIVENYFSLLKETNLKPLVLEPESVSLCRALIKDSPLTLTPPYKGGRRVSYPYKGSKGGILKGIDNPLITPFNKGEEGLIILDIGAKRSSIIIFDRGTIQFTMSLSISGEKITKTISEKLKITIQEAEKAKLVCGFDEKKCKGILKEILSLIMETLIKKIEDACSFYKEDHLPPNHRKITKVLLCGGGANFKGIEKILSQKLNLKVEKANPLQQIILPKNLPLSQSEALTYTTAIGLALRGVFENES